MISIEAVIILSLVALVLGILLVLADRYLATYGECTVLINGGEDEGGRTYVVEGGDTVLGLLLSNKIFIPSACGGKATCGFCKGKILEGAGPLLPTEKPYMSRSEIKDGTRLLCQIKVKNDLSVEIKDEYFNVKEFNAVVEKVEVLTHDTKLFRFRLLEPETEISFKPGQYVQYEIPGTGEYRAYSIASEPADKNIVELIVRLVPGGLCTTHMHNKLKEGDNAHLTGPYGDFFLHEENTTPVVCVGGGSGMAPIRSIVYHSITKGYTRPIHYFFGARAVKDLYMTEELMEYAEKHDFFKYTPALSDMDHDDKWDGETGLITQTMDKYLNDCTGWEAYMCGPPIMIKYATELLTKKGIRLEDIYFDEF